MGKMITAKRKDNEGEQAQLYIKTHILFPAGLMGLLAMVIGIVALVYQLIIETYDEWTFAKKVRSFWSLAFSLAGDRHDTIELSFAPIQSFLPPG